MPLPRYSALNFVRAVNAVMLMGVSTLWKRKEAGEAKRRSKPQFSKIRSAFRWKILSSGKLGRDAARTRGAIVIGVSGADSKEMVVRKKIDCFLTSGVKKRWIGGHAVGRKQ